MARPYRCYRCNNPFGIEFMADGPRCPKCGAEGPPHIVPLVYVHFLQPDANGPIFTKGSLKASVACMPQRPNLAGDHFAATPEVRAVTCPKCVGTPGFQAAVRELADVRGLTEQELLDEHPRMAGKGLLLVE